jgi:hypothetical protein
MERRLYAASGMAMRPLPGGQFDLTHRAMSVLGVSDAEAVGLALRGIVHLLPPDEGWTNHVVHCEAVPAPMVERVAPPFLVR